MNQRYDEYYVRDVARFGDTHPVFANQPIFTVNNIKLIDKGTKVDSALFERLVSHKLIPKIDQCLSVEDNVTGSDLRLYAQDLLDKDPGLTVLRGDSVLRNMLLSIVEQIVLLPAMAFKLTVAKTQRPEVFDHSVRITLIALYLARKSLFLTENELVTLATAALFHDLGMLHVPPELMAPGRRLKQSERHHLYAHPITAFLILREFPAYHPEISQTVLEHHERLDGSGYPRGIREEEICIGAQILMLAEVANTVFERQSPSQGLSKLSIVLRLNQRKFNSVLSNRLITLLGDMEKEVPTTQEETDLMSSATDAIEPRLREVACVLQEWHETFRMYRESACDYEPVGHLMDIINERVADLHKALSYAGVQTDHPDQLIEIARDDPRAWTELGILIGETRWQLAEIIHETNRRLCDISDAIWEERHMVLDWLEKSRQKLQLVD